MASQAVMDASFDLSLVARNTIQSGLCDLRNCTVSLYKVSFWHHFCSLGGKYCEIV